MRTSEDILKSIGCKGKFNVNKKKVLQAMEVVREEVLDELIKMENDKGKAK